MTGDLSARKLIPALLALHVAGELHPDTVVLGFGRSKLSDDELRAALWKAVQEHAPDADPVAWATLSRRIFYLRGDYADPAAYQALATRLEELGRKDHVYYTATPPETYGSIADGLAAAGLADESEGFRRLVVEKPFGTDLASAVELNEQLLSHFKERQVYRIDHYLAKETAQNLAVLRFANTLFEPMWSNRTVDHVQITMAEPIGVEGRGSFYDQAGVIRDVFQNHLLQLLALVAMEPPAAFEADAVRDEKVKVLKAVACAGADRLVLGQYTAAGDAPGYREEEGVDRASRTPTYVAVTLFVHNWRWAGVPFYVRAGKRLEQKASEIVLRFKLPPHQPFELDQPLKPDRLVLRLVPNEGISLRINAKHPGLGDIEIDRVSLDFAYQRAYDQPNPDAYERLILDVIEGDATLFMRADEVEAQWRVVAPMLEAAAESEPLPYPAGSVGPDAAFDLLSRDGRHWHRPGEDPDAVGRADRAGRPDRGHRTERP